MFSRTKLKLPRPHEFRRILDKALCEITLHTTDHIVVWRIRPLADDTKSMVFHDWSSTDPTEQALLNSTIEAENGHFRGWLYCYQWMKTQAKKARTHYFNFDRDFPEGEPGNKHTRRG